MSSYSRQQLEAWLKKIDVHGKVIDIGGSQKPIKGRTKSWDVQEYDILDLPVPHEQDTAPDFVKDLNTNGEIEEALDGYFDVAFAIEIMEYMYDPLRALKQMAMMLRRGGLLHISFHFVYPVHNPESQDYLRYTRSGVKKLLSVAGFEIQSLTPRYLRQPEIMNLVIQNEGMRGIGGAINVEQGYMITASRM